jgi:hypothetical protein
MLHAAEGESLRTAFCVQKAVWYTCRFWMVFGRSRSTSVVGGNDLLSGSQPAIKGDLRAGFPRFAGEWVLRVLLRVPVGD